MYPNVGLSTFSRYKRKFLSDSTLPKYGKQSKISTQTRNYIAKNFRNSSFNGAKGVQSYLLTLGIEMSLRGVRHVLKSEGFKARRKIKTYFVNATNKRKFFAWAKKYQHYTVNDWRKWSFSDETRTNMWGSDGKSYYWTDGATELLPYQMEPHIQEDGGSVLFLGLITAEKSGYGSTITEGNVNIEVYIDILQTSLLDTLEHY
jgi:transposase